MVESDELGEEEESVGEESLFSLESDEDEEDKKAEGLGEKIDKAESEEGVYDGYWVFF